MYNSSHVLYAIQVSGYNNLQSTFTADSAEVDARIC